MICYRYEYSLKNKSITPPNPVYLQKMQLMRNILGCFGLVLGLVFQSVYSQDTLVQDNNVEDIQTQLEVLASDEFQGRETGSKGLEKAANYIESYFISQDIKPYYESYKDTFYLKKKVAYNVIAYVKGSDPYLKREPVIIGAHYDHIGLKKAIEGDSIANGANDNISGTVGVLQLAKRLKDSIPKRPIMFVLFDAEEQGLNGSTYLAEKLKSEDVEPYVVFNIEMIGVPMPDQPQQVYLTGYDKSNFAELFNDYTESEALIFSPQTQKMQLFKRSDNFPFYKSFNIPAHTVSSFDFTNYEYYHHVKDEAELQDAEHINDLVEIWIKPILEIANHTEKLIKLND